MLYCTHMTTVDVKGLTLSSAVLEEKEVCLFLCHPLAAPPYAGGGQYPPPCKGAVDGGSKYIIFVLYACKKKYSLHVHQMMHFHRLLCSLDVWFHPASDYYRHIYWGSPFGTLEFPWEIFLIHECE